jgi:PAS domain S-box-containing protein
MYMPLELDKHGLLQRSVIESIALGAPLTETLDLLCRRVEALVPGAVCSVMLLNEDRSSLSVGAGPSLTAEARAGLEGLVLGETSGSCGTAAYTGGPVIAEDTTLDPRWATLQEAVHALNIRACWSYPILTIGAADTVGTFAISHGHPAIFKDHHRQILETASHLAGVAFQLWRAREAEREARREATELEMAINNAIPGIARLDEHDCYLMARDKYAAMLGYRPDEMIGLHVSKTIHPDDLSVSLAALATLRLEGRAETDVRGVRKDGSIFNKRCLLVTSHADHGRANGYYCFMDDITERKNAEVENRTLEEQLRRSQKLDAVGTLASGVAHDFNNILTAINGYAEIAKDSLPIGHPARQSIESLERASEQARSVTRGLLTFSNREPFSRDRIDLNAVTRDSITLLLHLLPASIDLAYTAEPAEPVWIHAGANQIQQVLMNLVINARDAIVGAGRVEISVGILHPGEICPATDRVIEREEAIVLIRDNGQGMPSDVSARAFEPFFTTKLRGKGTGLGLSIVHGIVSDHDGMIGLLSESGSGTTVIVSLPTYANSSPDAATATAASAPVRDLVLVAEDNADVGELMVAALESAGYRPILSRDGDAAMQAFREHAHEAKMVVMDLDLPKQSGLECVDQIRASHKDLPVLVVTGNIEQLANRRLTDNEQVLAKPFKLSELIRLVNEATRSTVH